MRRLKAGGTLASRQAIVHSLVHIEGWAIGKSQEALTQAMHLVLCFCKLCLRQTSATGVVCAQRRTACWSRQATLHARCRDVKDPSMYTSLYDSRTNSQAWLLDLCGYGSTCAHSFYSSSDSVVLRH